MAVYYKATRPDGTDFRTGTVLYEAGKVVTHPAKRVRNDPSTYLSVATVPTDCTGFSWPCRLFAVEGVGQGWKAEGLPNKRCFTSLRVVEELPSWQAFGPQGQEVAALIERAKSLTAAEVRALAAAWAAVGAAARAAARAAAWDAARDAARDAAWAAVGDAARDAARALVVRDTLSAEHFNALYGPWASVIEGVEA